MHQLLGSLCNAHRWQIASLTWHPFHFGLLLWCLVVLFMFCSEQLLNVQECCRLAIRDLDAMRQGKKTDAWNLHIPTFKPVMGAHTASAREIVRKMQSANIRNNNTFERAILGHPQFFAYRPFYANVRPAVNLVSAGWTRRLVAAIGIIDTHTEMELRKKIPIQMSELQREP
jgi:hypothetical protein